MLKVKRGSLLVFGLTPDELEHLKQGQPLNIKLDDIGIPKAGVVIFVGESNEAMKKKFESAGLDAGGKIDLSQVGRKLVS